MVCDLRKQGHRVGDERVRRSLNRQQLRPVYKRPYRESFFKTLKVERIDQVRYDTRGQARLDIVDWIEGFYNRARLHSSIGYRTPVDADSGCMAA